MGFQMNTISDEEHKRRYQELIANWEGTKDNAKELQFLHNDRFTPRQHKLTCGRCITRMNNRLKEYYGKG